MGGRVYVCVCVCAHACVCMSICIHTCLLRIRCRWCWYLHTLNHCASLLLTYRHNALRNHRRCLHCLTQPVIAGELCGILSGEVIVLWIWIRVSTLKEWAGVKHSMCSCRAFCPLCNAYDSVAKVMVDTMPISASSWWRMTLWSSTVVPLPDSIRRQGIGNSMCLSE